MYKRKSSSGEGHRGGLDNSVMKRVGLRKRLSQLFDRKQRSGRAPGARELTRTTKKPSSAPSNHNHAAQRQEAREPSVSAHAVMVDLTRQSGRIRESLASRRGLATDVLVPFMALAEFHCRELLSVVEECGNRIEQVNAGWKLDNPITRS